MAMKTILEPPVALTGALPESMDILLAPAEDTLARLASSSNGLSAEEVTKRQAIYGSNTVETKKKHSVVVDFLSGFKNPMMLVLICVAIIFGLTDDPTDMSIIIAILIMSVFLEFIQEYRAGKAVEALQKGFKVTSIAIRDGTRVEVNIADYVPGDIIVLSAGEIVAGDARIISAKDLFAQQSALTGESIPIEKQAGTITAEEASAISGWTNFLFMGSSIISGTGTAVIVRTGAETEYGKILERAMERKPVTEFDTSLKRFSIFLLRITILLVGFVFVVNALFNRGIIYSLLFAISLAIGITPDLLPMIVSVNLSKAAVRMARKKVIVKRLNSIQNFGSMDVLCTDKTGTLTENRIEMVLHVDINGNDNDQVYHFSYLNSMFETGLKSPLDEAIMNYKDNVHVPVNEYEKVDEIPFDFQRKRVSIIVKHKGGHLDMLTKGQFEEIDRICDSYELDEVVQPLDRVTRQAIEQTYIDLSAKGFRVLGVAYKEYVEERTNFDIKDEEGLIFIGFIAFLDPPKRSTVAAVNTLRANGITLKIVTGDSELVTKKICDDLGIPVTGIVLGNDVTNLSVDELARVVETANIFAKVTPSQKEKVIMALRKNGHVVGFMGDGINDTPPMKAADVSISVENAVDVAKETADIILLEQDLGVLGDGVLEGRTTFANTEKYMFYTISSNFGTMFSASAGSVFIPFLPMQPVQVLLNNLINDITLLPLPLDNVDVEYIQKPRKLNISFIGWFMVAFGPLSSIFDICMFIIMFKFFSPVGPGGQLIALNVSRFQTAFFVETLSCQLVIILAIRTRHVPFFARRPNKWLFVNILILLTFTLVIPSTPLGAIFGFSPLPPVVYGYIVIFWGIYFLIVEITKIFFYRRF
jgi:Mg2+-importing ATPase